MPTNEFLPFCPTDTGTNLLSESDYTAATDRTSGNKPGVASAKLNNKALRQATYVAGQLAQLISDVTATDTLDDATPAKFLAQLNAAIKSVPSVFTKYSTGSGTHNLTHIFYIAAGAATAGATYTNNSITFTVSSTIAAGTLLTTTGNGAPTVSGTLTKASGTGDATLTFYAHRAPARMTVRLIAGGGGGGGGGSGSGTGGTGGTTSFGTSLITAAGGVGGINSQSGGSAGAGGTASLGSGPVGVAVVGSAGNPTGANSAGSSGGNGGTSPFGGSGRGGYNTSAGTDGAINSGSGGGGCSGGGGSGAGGGAAGGFIDAQIFSPSGSYAYAVGAAGTAGSAGSVGVGGAGGSGIILVQEFF